MKTAVVQTNPIFGEVQKNVQEALNIMDSASADLYVLPELFNTGYNFIDTNEVQKLAEPVDGRTYQAMSQWAKKHHVYVVYGFAESSGDVYNSAALIGPEGLVGIYRKVHLFDRETEMFSQGNIGFPVYETPLGRIGIMICFDWIFPESARSLALKGAQLIAHPANLVLPYCPDAMVTRCLENRIFSATANRIGKEFRGGIDLTFIGKSEIVTPKGEIVGRLTSETTGISIQEIDLTLALNKRINQHNDLISGRRLDQYSIK